jgi:hypothetical protein
MWQDVKEILSLLSNLIFLGLLIATVTFVIRGWRKTAHLSNYSERVTRIDGRFPYTFQITVVPEFPFVDPEAGRAVPGMPPMGTTEPTAPAA